MATRLIGQRGRRTSSAAMNQTVVGKGKIFLQSDDGTIVEIFNPNNPTDMQGVLTRKLTAEEAESQRKRFMRGRAGKVAGRGKTKPKSRMHASQIDFIRRQERTLREEEEERRATVRPSVGRRI